MKSEKAQVTRTRETRRESGFGKTRVKEESLVLRKAESLGRRRGRGSVVAEEGALKMWAEGRPRVPGFP